MAAFPRPPEGRNRVLLVFPKLFPNKTYMEGEYVHYPQSCLQLAHALKKDDVPVTIIDGRTQENWREEIAKIQDEVMCVGISALTGQVSQGLEIAKHVRETIPGAPIIWGGWHPTIFHRESVESPHADIIARGEGDELIRDLVRALRNGEDLDGITGITYKVDGEIRVNPDRPLMKGYSMEMLPYEMLDPSKYEARVGQISIITSRGCPQDCQYCSIQSYYTRHWYGREADEIVDQMEQLIERFGIRHFIIQDSNFFVNPRRTHAICEGIVKRGLDITWEGSGHTKVLIKTPPETYELVKKSGCRQISVGVETGSPRMLNLIHKGLRLEQIYELAEVIKRTGLTFRTNFIIGLPGEEKEDLLATFDLVRKLHNLCPNHRATVYMYHPIPGSPLYDEEIRNGQIIGYPSRLEEWAEFRIESDTGWDVTRPWRGKDLIANYRNRDEVRMMSFYLWTGCLADEFGKRLPPGKYRLGFSLMQQMANLRLNTRFYGLPFEWWLYQFYRRQKTR
jgi:radical SAM superfamily enzyme YgiQ (UPF0313 family)